MDPSDLTCNLHIYLDTFHYAEEYCGIAAVDKVVGKGRNILKTKQNRIKRLVFEGKHCCGACTTCTGFAVPKYISVSDVEVLVYYRAHFNAVIINIAKVVLC